MGGRGRQPSRVLCSELEELCPSVAQAGAPLQPGSGAQGPPLRWLGTDTCWADGARPHGCSSLCRRSRVPERSKGKLPEEMLDFLPLLP